VRVLRGVGGKRERRWRRKVRRRKRRGGVRCGGRVKGMLVVHENERWRLVGTGRNGRYEGRVGSWVRGGGRGGDMGGGVGSRRGLGGGEEGGMRGREGKSVRGGGVEMGSRDESGGRGGTYSVGGMG